MRSVLTVASAMSRFFDGIDGGADFRGQQPHSVAHAEQVIAIRLELDVSLPAVEPPAEGLDFIGRVPTLSTPTQNCMACKVQARIRPLDYINLLITQSTYQPVFFSWNLLSVDESYTTKKTTGQASRKMSVTPCSMLATRQLKMGLASD